MRGLLTRDERTVIVFLAVATAIGALVLALRRVDPDIVPDLVAPGDAATVAAETRSAADDAPDGPVDVNSASVDELTRLPGIGPVKAAAIVGHRDRHGAFTSLESLLDVRGIGPATLERLRPMATLGRVTSTTEGNHREGR